MLFSLRRRIARRLIMRDLRSPLRAQGEHDRTSMSACHAEFAHHVRLVRGREVNGDAARAKPFHVPMPDVAISPMNPPPSLRAGEVPSIEFHDLDLQIGRQSHGTQKGPTTTYCRKNTRTEAPPSPSQPGDRAASSAIYNATLSPETDDDVVMQDRASDDDEESTMWNIASLTHAKTHFFISHIAR